MSDSEPEEHQHHQSLALAVAPFEWNGHKINLIDTPGYADFEGEARAGMAVADLAVFVVSAVAGPEVQTIRLWKAAAEMGLPRMVFVNKLDRERASFERTLDAIRAAFGAGVAPLELPIGEEADFRGVADLLTDTAFTYDLDLDPPARPAPPPGTRSQIPDEMEAQEHQVHDNLVEGIVVADDDLLERFLGRGHPEPRAARAHAGPGSGRGLGVPGRVRLGHRQHRARPAGRLPVRDRPVAARRTRPTRRSRHHRRSTSRPTPTGRPWPGSSRA